MLRRFFSMLALSVLFFSSIAMTSAVAAGDAFQNIDCSKAPDSTVCLEKGTTDNPLVGPDGIIIKVTQIITVIAGVAAIIIIVVSGLKFITGGGDSNEVASARKSIIFAIVGLVIIVSARLIIGLVVGNL